MHSLPPGRAPGGPFHFTSPQVPAATTLESAPVTIDMSSPATPAGTGQQDTYARAVEPEPSVTITDATFFGHGWQPTTIAVLQAIWFLPQGMQFTVDDLADWFRALGWKSTNGRPLGVEGVRRELALIRKAGYIRAQRTRGEGGRVEGIRYEVSKRPQDGAAAGPWVPFQTSDSENRRSHHVPLPTGHGGRPDMVGNGNRRSHHVPSATGHGRQPDMVGKPFPQVAPCAVAEPHPPHPPEEVNTSSPLPPAAAAPPEEEADRFPAEDIARAEDFLQALPAPWAAGRVTARKLAPALLDSAGAQGWDLDDDLAEELTANPGAVRSYPKVLALRIADLRRRPVRPAAAPSEPTPLPVETCDRCRDSRPRPGWVEVWDESKFADVLVPCDHRAAADAA